MRKIVILILLIVSFNGNSQDIDSLRKQIDSLENVKKDYELRIKSIDNKISELAADISSLKFKNVESIDFLIDQKLSVKIRDKNNTSGSIIAEPKNGEKIKLLDYQKESSNWVVSYNGKIGYVNEVLLKSNSDLGEFKRI